MNGHRHRQSDRFTGADTPHRHAALTWSLVLVLCVQTLIPIQSHTRWAQTPDGRLVEVCTLQGGVVVDAATGAPVADLLDTRTAAMDFSQLMTAAVSGTVSVQPAWLALVTVEHPPAVLGAPIQRSAQHTRIRAPPYLT